MNTVSLLAQVKSLEMELSVIKAQLIKDMGGSAPAMTFGSLYGILAGKSDSTEADIKAAGIHPDVSLCADEDDQRF
jgi:hypothetical protein